MVLLLSVYKEVALPLSVAASFFFFNQFVQFLFEGGFYSKVVSVQENMLYANFLT